MIILRLAAVLTCWAAAATAAPQWRFVDDRGVSWLVAPDGKKMLSRGVDCIGAGPEGKDFNPQNPSYAPAMRGGEAYAPWQARTLARLKSWGFNTAAGWSDARVGKAGLPFTPVLHIGVSLGAPWDDPFNPDFAAKANDLAKNLVAPTKGHRNRIGYFLDNEFGWGDDWILGIALGWSAKQPGKAKLIEVLRRTYHDDFRAFLTDFETSATGWDGLLSASSTGTRAGRGHRAQDAWVYEDIRKYNEVLAGAVRAADPGALILGDRYRQYYPQAVARAARGVLDAVSTNFEARTRDGWISPAYFISLHELSGLPVIVGEYYATARQNRSGNRNTGDSFTLMETQAQRAAIASAQARAFATFPFVVGWHWFQWMDEPVYGRDDHEDYNMGLVDIYDEPYAEITAAFAEVNNDADRLHAAGSAAMARWRGDGLTAPLPVTRQNGLVADGKLDDWDKTSPVPRSVITCEAPLRPFGDVFLAWDAGALRIAVRAYDFSIPVRDTPVASDPATWGECHRLTMVVDGATIYAAAGLWSAPKAAEESWKLFVHVARPPRGQISAAVTAILDRWAYIWEAAIPAASFGAGTLAEGRRIKLSLIVENRGDFEKMSMDGLELMLTDR